MYPRSSALALAAAAVLLASALGLGAAAARPIGDRTGAPGETPAASAEARAAPPAIRFGRDVRPLLADRCFQCHGPDSDAREAELRLDTLEGATADRGGYAAIVPGDPAASELLARIAHADPDERMPPAASHKKPLGHGERELLRRWIEAGAPYEPHWAFVPPVRPALPPVGDPDWCRNEIDRFVLAGLEAQGVEPSPPAERETLLRRAFLDLTGLPPTPEEIDAFLADERPDAYERWVDRLLTEEPYRTRCAEHTAVAWLDAARYADTIGIHTDAGRQIWPWRDGLLRALREDMPLDQFVVEQLAGDLLPDATQDQIVASGFHRNQVTSDEGGALSDEYLVEYAAERVATTGAVFLGLTLGCARCHEHKFDPVSQEDFYGLFAFFNSIDEPGVYSQLPDANRAFEPSLRVPTREQSAELARLDEQRAVARADLERPLPGEAEEKAAFLAEIAARSELAWAACELASAASEQGAALTEQPDGSVLVSGANPERDVHRFALRTQAEGLSLILLEALADPSLHEGRVGRADNGNAVLSEISAAAVSLADPSRTTPVHLTWAWAEFEQQNGDFGVLNAIDGSDERGFAVDGHRREGNRLALFLADEPFGFPGGTELRIELRYQSIYAAHAFGRVRLSLGRLGPGGRAALGTAQGDWYVVGPFASDDRAAVFDQAFGPESDAALDLQKNFGAGNQYWKHAPDFADGREHELAEGVHAIYVARRVIAPSARRLDVSLGSDDGIRVFLDGAPVFENRIDRSLSPDQDQASIELPAGAHVLALKIVNTGGESGFYYRALPAEGALEGDALAALVPAPARWSELDARLTEAWRHAHSPAYRALTERAASIEKAAAEIEAEVAQTMVMKELPEPRATAVLTRGRYDQPDASRPVERRVPAVLGRLPDDAPRDRLGLARWLVSAENPLLARVLVNRVWQQLFGTGLVATAEDFGLQGEWPSHPELLDWLAVELRAGGWSRRELVRRIATSATYRQSSRVRPELAARDPNGRWLASFPRRRLTAEQIRDQALYAAGLLVEQLGGPSVKPYQPDGLWQEVAMKASNTREYERGPIGDLWRRSLYTYWKRACPPPALTSFDAPTRESCTIRRSSTNTPLQALVLWNDEQFVEAARALAARALARGGGDSAALANIFRSCTGRTPPAEDVDALAEALAGFRARYRADPESAARLLAVGEAPVPEGLDPAELAAWTLVASAVLGLDAAITQS